MGIEQRIAEAKGVLRHLQRLRAKRHSRIHDGAAEDNTNRLRALEGKCGQCDSLILGFRHEGGKDVVAVRCREKLSPLDLYRNTPPGQTPSCPGFKERKLK